MKFRPYLFEFLEFVSERFEVIIFCSGSELYCSSIIDAIEHRRSYFAHRVYNDHVLLENSSYCVKDYEFLMSGGRNEGNTVIVEHTVASYCTRLFNGVPVQRFDPTTPSRNPELVYLAKFLEELDGKSNVGKHIEETIKSCLSLMILA